jgi:hypothetical protein
MILYIATPPSHPHGCSYKGYVQRFHTYNEALDYMRDHCIIEILDANTLIPAVDWKNEWVTTVDTEVDLA